MTTDYDAIAADYRRAKQQPWRYFIERYTLLRLIGKLEGVSVLDLACGEGYYTRELRHRGAAGVVGVDLSEGMIRLAQEEEKRSPLGIEYIVGDARKFDGTGRFDLVVRACLSHHASTPEELAQMCAAVARALRPGGRFVTVNNNPSQPPEHFAATRKYGFIKSTPVPSLRGGEGMVEGTPIIYTIFQEEGSFDITNYFLSTATHEECLRAAGLRDVRWHKPRLSPEGQAAFGDNAWEAFLSHPPITFLECVR